MTFTSYVPAATAGVTVGATVGATDGGVGV